MLIDTEGTYTIGYGDGTDRPLDSALTLLPGAWQAATTVPDAEPETSARIQRVIEVSAGFESLYGMELLSTVHWVIRHDGADPDNLAEVARQVAVWTQRKAGLFTPAHVEAALGRLRELEWV